MSNSKQLIAEVVCKGRYVTSFDSIKIMMNGIQVLGLRNGADHILISSSNFTIFLIEFKYTSLSLQRKKTHLFFLDQYWQNLDGFCENVRKKEMCENNPKFTSFTNIGNICDLNELYQIWPNLIIFISGILFLVLGVDSPESTFPELGTALENPVGPPKPTSRIKQAK